MFTENSVTLSEVAPYRGSEQKKDLPQSLQPLPCLCPHHLSPASLTSAMQSFPLAQRPRQAQLLRLPPKCYCTECYLTPHTDAVSTSHFPMFLTPGESSSGNRFTNMTTDLQLYPDLGPCWICRFQDTAQSF